MNRRQKMKRMKQELECCKLELDLYKHMWKNSDAAKIAYDSRQMRVETLKAEELVVAKDLMVALPPEKCIHDRLNKMLLEDLQNYIVYDRKIKPWSGPLPEEFVYTAELKVVVPYGGDRI